MSYSEPFPENPLVNFRTLAIGATFHLDAYPGNTYRKTGPGTAEFVVSRHGFHGAQLPGFGSDRGVRRQPADPLALELLGLQDDPFTGAWTPPPGYELLGLPPAPRRLPPSEPRASASTDLLGDPPPKSAKAEARRLRRAARKARQLL